MVDSDYHVYTNRWKRVTHTLFCVKYTHIHADTHTQTHFPVWPGSWLCSFVGGYLTPLSGCMGRLSPSHYLLYNQLWLQNNLIPLTGTLRSVVAMPARCPAPGYNFTPLYTTQSGSYVYPYGYYGNAFFPIERATAPH